ncbi:MAG: ATP-dependent zinc metalloprotease FtsH [Planctomycetota bacterium]
MTEPKSTISYSYFMNLVKGLDFDGKAILNAKNKPIGTAIEQIEFGANSATGTFKIEPLAEPTYDGKQRVNPKAEDKLQKRFLVYLPEDHKEVLAAVDEAGIEKVSVAPESNAIAWVYILFLLLSLGLVFFVIMSVRRSQNQMMGGGGFLSNFSRSPAKRYDSSLEPITFKDVAGLEGVKADLNEIVEFLKDPSKFQKLGGRVPKGALLIGPPGTGKTLLARAVAGEAGVPFFSVNGSEFIQMFVGVGASRVRDLFATAKANAPAIIFVDEIDAVGRQRGAGLGGGHDEREQTLNQILGEMDGFQANDAVIVVAATNRPDILDPALLRPGRFDRKVTVSRPTKAGRLAIFKVHVRDVPLAADVNLETMAAATVGMTGADIQNLVNEAALWAARNDKNKVEMADFYYAHDKVLMGARREEIISEEEKEKTAYHEAGHTLTAWKLDGAYPVHKVTIIPRGRSLGVTQMVPDEDRLSMAKRDILDTLIMLLGGRAAELLIYDELTVGAEQDLEQATSLARRMVTHWGMSEKLGPVSYKMSDDDPFLGGQIHKNRQFSEHTMETIDEEVQLILRTAAEKALELLKSNQDDLEAITKALLEHEELDREDITELIGPSVHSKKLDAAKQKLESAKSEPVPDDNDDENPDSSEPNDRVVEV